MLKAARKNSLIIKQKIKTIKSCQKQQIYEKLISKHLIRINFNSERQIETFIVLKTLLLVYTLFCLITFIGHLTQHYCQQQAEKRKKGSA